MSNTEPKVTKGIRAHVNAVGIKKRCRKEEFHVLPVGDYPENCAPEIMIEKAKSVLASEMKSFRSAKLRMLPAEHSDYGNGVVITSVSMMIGDSSKDINLMVGA